MDRTSSRGFASDSDLKRIAADGRNVALYPLLRGELIEIAVVAKLSSLTLPGQFRKCKEAESPKSIVETDEDHPFARERSAIVDVGRRPSLNKPSAMNLDHNRKFAAVVIGCPDVDVKTVFGGDGAPGSCRAAVGICMQS